MNYSPAHPMIDAIAALICAKLPSIQGQYKITDVKRIRSPIQELKFLNQLECFGCTDPETVGYGFHGTSATNIKSIIANGFFSPYMQEYNKKCGNKYGQGVYVAQTLAFASLYSTGCMIVAAVAFGESKNLKPADALKMANREIDADSYIVPPEIVLRGATQALPMFIIQYSNRITQHAIPDTIADYNTTQSAKIVKPLHAVYSAILPCVLEHIAEGKTADEVVDIVEMFDYETPQLYR